MRGQRGHPTGARGLIAAVAVVAAVAALSAVVADAPAHAASHLAAPEPSASPSAAVVAAAEQGRGPVKPLGGHELGLVLLQFGLLLLVARALGEVAVRLKLPSVMGELTAGLVLGPTLLGSIAPGAFDALFPQEPAQVHLLEVISWLGVIMLLILTGLETDVRLIARKGKGAALISAGGIAIPFLTGVALGSLLPGDFIAKPDQRLVFALFVGTAMSISAIPVIAKVLMEMNVIRRDIGQVTLAAGMIDDTVGWVLLSVVAGMASGGGSSLGTAGTSILAVVGVLAFAFVVGRRAVPATIRLVDNHVGGDMAKITVLMVLALAFGSLTHALKLEAVLGAFIVGVLVGQVKRFDQRARHTFEQITLSVFAPVFFATAGLRVDLGALFKVKVFAVALAVVAVAILGKFAGAYVGARLSRLGHWEALSLGAGMNARGAMEIIVATIGLSSGVLTQDMYSIIVVMAIVTSLMAPPLLRWTLGKVEMGEEEKQRLEDEERERGSFVGNLKRVLLPTSGGPSSRVAARLVGLLVAGQDVEVTNMYVQPRRNGRKEGSDDEVKSVMDQVEADLELPKSQLRRVVRGDQDGDRAGSVMAGEATRGYDLLVVGTSGQGSTSDGPMFSGLVDDLVQESPCPVLIVRARDGRAGADGAEPAGPESLRLHRVLLPVFGGDSDRYAAEVAFSLARDQDMVVDVVHMVRGGERRARLSDDEAVRQALRVGQDLVGKVADLGHSLGATVHTDVVVADHEEEAIVERAADGADLIVMASSRAPVTERAFFGHHLDYVVRHAPCPVVVVSSP